MSGLNKKYICLDCDAVFDEPTEYIENVSPEPYGFKALYQFGCPECSGAYEEAEQCKGCDDYFHHYELSENYCKKCGKKIIKRLQYFLNNEFTQAEREYLAEVYDEIFN